MKQQLLLGLPIGLALFLAACQPTPPAKELKGEQLRFIESGAIESPVSTLLTNNITIPLADTIVAVASPEADLVADHTSHLVLVDGLRSLDETTIEPAEVVIGLRTFAGETIAESMAFLFLLHQDTLKLYVDYFNGDLAGSKVFYIAAGELLAVDILKIENTWTEGGQQVNSILTHSFYYKEKELVHCVTHQHPERQALLDQENQEDWDTIRRSLQLL